MPEHLSEYHTSIKRNFLIGVPVKRGKQNLWLGVEVLDGGKSGADLPSEQVVKDLNDILSRLELELGCSLRCRHRREQRAGWAAQRRAVQSGSREGRRAMWVGYELAWWRG